MNFYSMDRQSRELLKLAAEQLEYVVGGTGGGRSRERAAAERNRERPGKVQ